MRGRFTGRELRRAAEEHWGLGIGDWGLISDCGLGIEDLFWIADWDPSRWMKMAGVGVGQASSLSAFRCAVLGPSEHAHEHVHEHVNEHDHVLALVFITELRTQIFRPCGAGRNDEPQTQGSRPGLYSSAPAGLVLTVNLKPRAYAGLRPGHYSLPPAGAPHSALRLAAREILESVATSKRRPPRRGGRIEPRA